ncbi:hypothetical protein [Nonomuraea angiospora]|uniref:hypothetical protein n=1 Tax=Nonomuraea angiospora TaxID=46172 RepID=UPI0029B1DF5E|nr:hypothetical protein [Nonomuraea angiospora]MDX3110683.1 hypothetical protein [Nonomuraea angiospora]
MLSEVAGTARVTAALLAQYAPPSEQSQNGGIAAAARPPVIAKTSAPVSRRAALRTSLVRSAASRPPITRGRAPAVRPAPRGSSAGKATRSRTTVRLPGAWAWLSPIVTVCKA